MPINRLRARRLPMPLSSPTAPDATAPTGRHLPVDALRGIAVLLVLGRHLDLPANGLPGVVAGALAAWQRIGWIGVDLFFVLSGFLVGGLLFHEHRRHGDVQAWRFLARRGCKIYPGFVALLLYSAWFAAPQPTSAWWHEALFVQNYLTPRIWNHTWSLAVEEHFYIGLALVLAMATRRRRGTADLRRTPHAIAGLCGLALAMRCATWCWQPADHLLFPTHLRLDALGLGVGIAYAWHQHRERTMQWTRDHRFALRVVAAVLLVPCCTLCIEGNAFLNTVGLTANAAAFGAVLLLTLARPDGAASAATESAARIGRDSYSIYLWHMPIAELVRWHVTPWADPMPALACYLVGSIAIGLLAARIIERPFLAWRDRRLPHRAPSGLLTSCRS